MSLIRIFGDFFHKHFVPAEHNAYRPNSLSRDVLMATVALTCVIEGFLVASLFIQSKPNDFTAAVLQGALVSLTNDQRVQHSENELRVDPVLTRAAQAKAEDMAQRGYFSHVGPTGEAPWKWFADAGYDYAYAGENLATRFYESSDVVQAWMNSPGHRENILKPVYQDIGIGIASGMYQGEPTTFVVQFFGTTKAELGIAPLTPDTDVASLPETTPKPQVIKPHIPAVQKSLVSTPVTQTVSAIQPSAVKGDSVSSLQPTRVPGSFARYLSSPRTIALAMLGAILAFLILSLLLASLIRIHIQPLDLLLNGAVVAVFTLLLLSANVYFLSGADIGRESAATLQSIEALH